MDAKRVMEGLTVVTVGSILLGNTTGYLPWGVWWDILSLWPLLIVALGFEILGKSLGSDLLRAFSSLLVIAGLLVGALVLPGSDVDFGFWVTRSWDDSKDFDFVHEHERGVDEGLAVITVGAGELSVAEGDDLVSSAGVTPFSDSRFDVEVDGDRAVATLDAGDGQAAGALLRMDVALDRDVVWEIELSAGAADVEADLSRLQVERLAVDAGVAHVDIKFGAQARRAEATVSAGVAGVVLRVPGGIGVEVRSEGGLSGVSVDEALERVEQGGDGRVWRTPGFEDEARTISIALETGVSGVDVVVY